jgi:Delta7-sterol 5-desaturase
VNDVVQFLLTRPWGVLLPWLLALNVGIFIGVVALGGALVRLCGHRKVASPPPLDRFEIGMSVVTVALNTVVTVAGLALIRAGIIRVRDDWGWWSVVDALVLLLAMDVLMYALHRVAHVKWLYPLIHKLHHKYDRPRPIDLFVLSPQENVAFGALWLALLWVYPSSWLGMSLYLTLNTVFGGVGHLGVEPLPDAWVRTPVLRWIATSTFHAQHHGSAGHNLGFYTLIWDKLFGTLSPEYERSFGRERVIDR